MRPVSTWNYGKQQEFLERREYTLWSGSHIEMETDTTGAKK
jgi:hypothetical protein